MGMKCSKCGFDSLPEMKYCGMCGSLIARTCPNCGYTNPQLYRFCGMCGTTLDGEPVSSSQIGTILPSSTLPEFLELEPVEEKQDLLPEGERMVVTVLLTDVTGSTNLLEQVGNEVWVDIMNRILYAQEVMSTNSVVTGWLPSLAPLLRMKMILKEAFWLHSRCNKS
jgi:hypothetical protein